HRLGRLSSPARLDVLPGIASRLVEVSLFTVGKVPLPARAKCLARASRLAIESEDASPHTKRPQPHDLGDLLLGDGLTMALHFDEHRVDRLARPLPEQEQVRHAMAAVCMRLEHRVESPIR